MKASTTEAFSLRTLWKPLRTGGEINRKEHKVFRKEHKVFRKEIEGSLIGVLFGGIAFCFSNDENDNYNQANRSAVSLTLVLRCAWAAPVIKTNAKEL